MLWPSEFFSSLLSPRGRRRRFPRARRNRSTGASHADAAARRRSGGDPDRHRAHPRPYCGRRYGAPLRRAQVRLSAAEVRVNRSATTDAEGRYEFPDLPAGRYNVSVSRSGFVSLPSASSAPSNKDARSTSGMGSRLTKSTSHYLEAA